MKRSQQLRLLADRVRNNEPVNWGAELNSMTLEQAANDAEYAEGVSEQSARQLSGLSGVSDSRPEVKEADGSEVA